MALCGTMAATPMYGNDLMAILLANFRSGNMKPILKPCQDAYNDLSCHNFLICLFKPPSMFSQFSNFISYFCLDLYNVCVIITLIKKEVLAMDNIGERIKHFRKINGLSQVELAKRANISKQTMYKYENGIVTNIPSDKIETFAKIFGVTPAILMGWSETNSAIPDFVYVTEFEIKLILAYRKSDMQEAVLKLLGMSQEEDENR